MADDNSGRETYTTNVYKTDIDNVSFLGNTHIDNVVSSLLAIGTELWMTRKRLHVVEGVVGKNGITPEQVEKYEPTEDEKALWEAEREQMVKRLYAHGGRTDKYTFLSEFEDQSFQERARRYL